MDKDKRIIFILQRKETISGGNKMDLYLWELTLKYPYKTRVIELDSLYKTLPNWLIKLLNVNYLLRRTVITIFYTALLLKERNSIIYLSSLLLEELYLYLLIVRFLFDSRIIFYVHLTEEAINKNITDNKIKRFFKNKIIHTANIILTNSIYSKNKLLSFGIPEEKIKIIYPLLLDWPSNQAPENKKRQGKTILLFIGTEFSRKGLKFLLRALEILDRSDVFLNIVGDENKEFNSRFVKDNLDLIKRLESQNKIKFLGEVMESHHKEKLFAAADVFVMPSLSEGFGIVFAEAMSYRLPIIAADTTAAPELVHRGYNGILVPPGDSKALAKAIEILADNKELRIKMGNNGYEKIKEFYESYSIENEFLPILEKLSR